MCRTPGVRPILVFGYGNPSRGDDAVGPLLIERLAARQRTGELQQVDLLTDFQLQIEHALDMLGRGLVVFVDAAVQGPEPFAFESVEAERNDSYTTHAMTPEALLRVYEQFNGDVAPRTRLLAIRGYGFDLGSSISAAAAGNLEQATERLLRLLQLAA